MLSKRISSVATVVMLAELAATASGAAPAQAPTSRMPAAIGPAPIRFYSGNGSVGHFRNYWGAKLDDDAVSPEKIAQIKRCGCRAFCDYLAWCTVEPEPGRWDFSFYQRNADALIRAGIAYNVFCWLQFPPKWFIESDRFVGYQNLASGKTIPQMSLWSPETLTIYDEFYKQLSAQFGKRITFVRLAMPSEYGEVGYCTGMTKWLVPQDAAEPGYWCGDRYAREDFKTRSLARYDNLTALNKAWGTTFASKDDITMPDVVVGPAKLAKTAEGRTRWLDFMEWYQQSWTDFMSKAVDILRKHSPDRETIISLGYGAERGPFGNDQGRHIAAMGKLKVAAQTPGAIGYFATRRVSSSCRVYGVDYFTEPPGSVDRDQQVLRIWMDASNGTQTWFDYLQNLDGARDLLVRYKRHLTGKPPVCELAFWLPTFHQYLHPDEAWPASLEQSANAFRDLGDYEVLDDHALRDGGLDKLGIRVLVLVEADCLSGPAVDAVKDWVAKGGVLITFETRTPAIRGGNERSWKELAVDSGKLPSSAPRKDGKWAWNEIWESCGRSIGKGRMVAIPSAKLSPRDRNEILTHYVFRLSEHGPYADCARVDGEADHVLTTLLADRILFYNDSAETVSKQVKLREADFGTRTGTPAALERTLKLQPHEIAAIPLLHAPKVK